MGLSLLSTLCSISCVNTDLHPQNICVYRPDFIFQHKWTVRISSHLIEFSWNSNGAVTTIDWEYNTLYPRLPGSLTQSAFLVIPWETRIGDFSRYGLNLSGNYSGERGMAVVLSHVFSSFKSVKFRARYGKLLDYGDAATVSSQLEVFPIGVEEDSSEAGSSSNSSSSSWS